MGFEVNEKGNLYLNLPDSALKEARTFLGGKTERLAGIAPISNIKVKNWTPEKTAELAIRLEGMSYNIVLFCADKEFSKNVRNLIGDDAITVVERVDFSLLMGIIALCNIFIGVDTGPTHLAAALGVPAVGLYGPTSGIVTGPYGERAISVQSEVDCPYYRPISPFSPKERLQECYVEDKCKLSMTNCVGKIETQSVMEAIYRVLVKRG
jgi:ADP-heptose:LPS heptosyltransferase